MSDTWGTAPKPRTWCHVCNRPKSDHGDHGGRPEYLCPSIPERITVGRAPGMWPEVIANRFEEDYLWVEDYVLASATQPPAGQKRKEKEPNGTTNGEPMNQPTAPERITPPYPKGWEVLSVYDELRELQSKYDQLRQAAEAVADRFSRAVSVAALDDQIEALRTALETEGEGK